MKKTISLILALVIILALCGCNSSQPPEGPAPTIEVNVPVEKEETIPPEDTAAPEESIVPEVTDAPEETIIPEETAVPEETAPELIDGMRPEFKEAMDAYEAFYDEYCEFMTEYSENPADFTLLAKYGELMIKAAEMDKAFEEWDEDELNDAELKYYVKVSNRITEKLLDVSL